MTIYGETESRCQKNEIYERWMTIKEVIYDILNDGEDIIIVGDLNKKVGNDKYGVMDNSPVISVGGFLVRDLAKTGSLVLANNLPNCIGGPFTRFYPADPSNIDKMSFIDFVLVSPNLVKYVNIMEIILTYFTKWRLLSCTSTDHFTIIFK